MIQLGILIPLLLAGMPQGQLNAIDVSEADSEISLSQHLQFIEDTQGDLDFNDVLKQQGWSYLSEGNQNRGLTESAYWLRISLRNTATSPLSRILTVGSETLYDVRTWQLHSDGRQVYTETGSRFHFEKQLLQTSLATVPITFKANERITLIIRVENLRPLDLTTQLLSHSALFSSERRRSIQAGAFVGAMLMLILYNFALGFRLSSLFLLHAIFSTFLLILFARPSAITWQYLWPDHGSLDARVGPLAASISFLCGLLFLKKYFVLPKLTPRLSKVLTAYAWLPLILVVAMLGQPHQLVASIIVKVIGLGVLFWLGLTLWAVYERLDGAIGYAASWGLILIGGVVYSFWLTGHSSNLNLVGNLIKLSAVAQIAGLSISARRRVARSQQLLEDTNKAVQMAQKINQVNQLNDVFKTLGHEFANPIGAIQLAQDEIKVRLRKIHRLSQKIHGQEEASTELSQLYQELDTLYGLHEASQDAAQRLGALRAILDTQLKLQESKSESICVNDIIRDVTVLAASDTEDLDIQHRLAGDLPGITGFQSHLTHVVLYYLRMTAKSLKRSSQHLTRPERDRAIITLMTNRATRLGVQGIEVSFIDKSGELPTTSSVTAEATGYHSDDNLVSELNQVLTKLIQDSHGIHYDAFIHEITGECHQVFFLPIHGQPSAHSAGI